MGKLLKPPQVLELYSDLGGGKTTFVQGLAKGVGSKAPVTSPTFTLNQIYSADGVKISHHDFYRLNEAGIMSEELGESLQDDRTITVVEWGDVVRGVLPEERIRIEFKPTLNDSEGREIIFRYPRAQTGLIKQLETNWTRIRP